MMKNRTINRFLSALLALTLLMGMLPLQILAESPQTPQTPRVLPIPRRLPMKKRNRAAPSAPSTMRCALTCRMRCGI